MYHLLSIKWVIVEKFGHLINAVGCVMDLHIHYKVNLQNNQEHIILLLARDVRSFLPKTREEHPTKTRAITSWELVNCHNPLHGRICVILVC